jgi:hypothetical protein
MDIPKIDVPGVFVLIDQGDQLVWQTIDQFFNNTLERLGIGKQEQSIHVNINARELLRPSTTGDSGERGEQYATNDTLVDLVVHDLVIATVYLRRNEFNRTQVCCALYLDQPHYQMLQQRRASILKYNPDG